MARVDQLSTLQHRRFDEETIEQLNDGIGRQMLHTETMTVARLMLQAGAVVPMHSHPSEQVANVVFGTLRFVVGEEEIVVTAGQSLAIPADVPHEAMAIEDALVLDVFSPPREDWIRGDDAYLRAVT